MNIRQLNIFINVAKTLNITKTSKELYLAQPSISLAIKELENEYNIKLFKRIKQHLILTEEGKVLLRYAKQIISDINLFNDKANNLAVKPKLNFACSLSVGENYLANLIKNYEGKEDFSFHFNILKSSKIINGILNGDYDLGIVESEVNDKTLIKIKLLEDRLKVIANYDFPLNELEIYDLNNYNLILREELSGTRTYTNKIFDQYNLNVVPYVEASTNESVLDFVKNGLGIGILPSICCNKYILNKSIKEIKLKDINLIRSIYLIYLNNKILSENEIKLLNYFKNNFK